MLTEMSRSQSLPHAAPREMLAGKKNPPLQTKQLPRKIIDPRLSGIPSTPRGKGENGTTEIGNESSRLFEGPHSAPVSRRVDSNHFNDSMRRRPEDFALDHSDGDFRVRDSIRSSASNLSKNSADTRKAPAIDASSTVLPDADASTLENLEAALKLAGERVIKPEIAADLINRLRRMGPTAQSSPPKNAAATNTELMEGISAIDEAAWYEAMGLEPKDVDMLRWAAFKSGLPNPTGSFLNNAMQFIVSPWLNYVTKRPWDGVGFGLATAAIGAPMNAFQQSSVVTLCESIRERSGPVIVPDKKNINDRNWLPELVKDLKHQIEQFSEIHDLLDATMTRFGIRPGEHNSALAALPPDDRQVLLEQARHLLEAEKKLHETQGNFLMTQGSHERQWKGNTWQAIPRTLRSPVAGFVGLVSKSSAARFLSPTAQTLASLVLTASQHVAAGFDEQAKQDYNNKLNLLHGDCFTQSGHDKRARGEPIDASDIDAEKLRHFIQMPAQSLVKRTYITLNRQIVQMENSLRSEPIPLPEGCSKYAANFASREFDAA